MCDMTHLWVWADLARANEAAAVGVRVTMVAGARRAIVHQITLSALVAELR